MQKIEVFEHEAEPGGFPSFPSVTIRTTPAMVSILQSLVEGDCRTSRKEGIPGLSRKQSVTISRDDFEKILAGNPKLRSQFERDAVYHNEAVAEPNTPHNFALLETLKANSSRRQHSDPLTARTGPTTSFPYDGNPDNWAKSMELLRLGSAVASPDGGDDRSR